MQQFAHDSHDRLEPSSAASQQTAVEGRRVRLAAQRHQRRHVKGAVQVTTAASADPGSLLHGSARGELQRI
jgi:hypothetical protein